MRAFDEVEALSTFFGLGPVDEQLHAHGSLYTTVVAYSELARNLAGGPGPVSPQAAAVLTDWFHPRRGFLVEVGEGMAVGITPEVVVGVWSEGLRSDTLRTFDTVSAVVQAQIPTTAFATGTVLRNSDPLPANTTPWEP